MDIHCEALAAEDFLARPLTTFYAPNGRETAEELQRKAELLQNIPLLTDALDAIPNMVVLLTATRQIAAANRAFLGLLQMSLGEVVSKRPGEAVGCIRAAQGPDGCGTSRHCATCGAVQAILHCQQRDERAVRDCRILVQTPGGVEPMDLRVTASPFEAGGTRFVLTTVEDISQSKRLGVLQRAFFHDALNTAGCIQGYSQYLSEESSTNPEICLRLGQLSDQLIETIQAQRDLMIAEAGELKTQPVPLRVTAILEELRSQYAIHPVAVGRPIVLRTPANLSVTADRQLLMRVLGNMVKNALEAIEPGACVTVGCQDEGSHVAFWVHNPSVMSTDVQLQVFQRSFSTKGESGRGLGTYSMKLLGERYLGGKVSFTSRELEGTTFTFALPKLPA